MNIDLSATTGFNDRQGLQNFLLVHRFVHLETATALTANDASAPQTKPEFGTRTI